MELVDFLEEQEVNRDTTAKIITECSRFNEKLKEFLRYQLWDKIPATTIEKLINCYQRSKVNLRTGEIIEPDSLIPLITFNYKENVSIGIKYALMPINSTAKADLYAILISDAGYHVKTISFMENSYNGIKLNPEEEYKMRILSSETHYSQFMDINFSELDTDINQIIFCSYLYNPWKYTNPYEHFTFNYIDDENEELIGINCTKEMNEAKNIIGFSLKKVINDWELTTIQETFPGDLNDLISYYISKSRCY